MLRRSAAFVTCSKQAEKLKRAFGGKQGPEIVCRRLRTVPDIRNSGLKIFLRATNF